MRHDAEGDELALLGRGERGTDSRLECSDIANHMVRGQHQQHRIVPCRVLQGRERGQRDRRRGVATEGLEHDRARLDLDLPQLLGDEEAVRIVADDDRRGPPSPSRRSAVSCSMVRSLVSASSCLG